MTYKAIFSLAGTLCFLGASALAAFLPGTLYSTDFFSTDIYEYDVSGAVAGSFAVSASGSVRGLAFGPDELLYVAAGNWGDIEVQALDDTGTVQETYTLAGEPVGGNISFGQVAFGSGNDFYVGTTDGVVRFTVGAPGSGVVLGSGPVYDVCVLPSGHLLVAAEDKFEEWTSTGSLVREIVPDTFTVVDARAVAYDPDTGIMYASMLGDSGQGYFWIMAMDFATGAVTASVQFNQPLDLVLLEDGNILAGSRGVVPGIFSPGLSLQSSLGGGPRMFVAEVPNPPSMPATGAAGLSLLAAGLLGLGTVGMRRRAA